MLCWVGRWIILSQGLLELNPRVSKWTIVLNVRIALHASMFLSSDNVEC